jgi:hypothetical protein
LAGQIWPAGRMLCMPDLTIPAKVEKNKDMLSQKQQLQQQQQQQQQSCFVYLQATHTESFGSVMQNQLTAKKHAISHFAFS